MNLRDCPHILFKGLPLNKMTTLLHFSSSASPPLDLLNHIFVIPAAAMHHDTADTMIVRETSSFHRSLGPGRQPNPAAVCDQHHILSERHTCGALTPSEADRG